MSRLLPLETNTDIVTLTIQVDGTELPGHISVLAVEIVQQVNRISYARLRVADGNAATSDFPVSAGDLFVPGNELSVLAGYHGEAEAIFSGIVFTQRAVVRSSESWLEIDVRDPTVKMSLVRRNRHFEDMTDSDIAEELISEYGLEADIAATEVTHPQLLQYHASDWDFIVSRLEANGQLCLAKDGKITSFVPTLDEDPDAEILYGATLLELDAEFDARTQSAVVKSFSWDAAGQELLEAEAADPGWEGNGNLASDNMTAATGREEDQLWHGGSIAADALQAWADGSLLRARIAASSGRARFKGLPNAQVGRVIQLSGLGDRFNGKVLVTGVRHEFTDNTWVTDTQFGMPRKCQAELFDISQIPAAGLVPAVSGLQIGIVTQLAGDPAGESRIRVKIPVAGFDEQGIWARVATLDAGAERGTFFRPEVDDEVVVGFFHDDPAQAVVIGMLHSSAKAPPEEATEDNHKKMYVSRSGIKLIFDDEESVLTLQTPGENFMTLSDADSGITLEDQNGNSIVMNGDGIALTSAGEIVLKADSDLKLEGMNTEVKASTEFKAEGGASAELKSSGTLTVKGSLVQIN